MHSNSVKEDLSTVLDTKLIIGFDLAITISSSPFCTLFDIVPVQLVERKVLKQQSELRLLMLNKWRKLFHSSRVKLQFVSVSASWFLVSMYVIWIFGSQLILLNNHFHATLWVWDTCLTARIPSTRKPASSKTIPDSVEVCFLHIQLMGTKCSTSEYTYCTEGNSYTHFSFIFGIN